MASANNGTSGINATGATKQTMINNKRKKKSTINQVTIFSEGLNGVIRGKCSLCMDYRTIVGMTGG
ncbi:MAG: hypothetical protein WCJ93_08785 [Methanomicrobiales archaeon]